MNINKPGLQALAAEVELQELSQVGTLPRTALKTPGLRLKRTFNQKWLDGSVTRFWRVLAPAICPNLNSDLSYEGLCEWGLI